MILIQLHRKKIFLPAPGPVYKKNGPDPNASAKETSSIVSCFYFMDSIFIGPSISPALIWVYCINRPRHSGPVI